MGNSAVSIRDNRTASIAAGTSVMESGNASILRVDFDHTAYSITDLSSRKMLASDLKHVINSIFDYNRHERSDGWVYEKKSYLMEAVGLLAKESPSTLLMRQSEIQRKLDKFFDLMDKVEVYSTMPQDFLAELYLSNALKRFTTSLNTLTNRKLSVKELALLSQIDLDIPQYFILNTSKLTSKRYHSRVYEALSSKQKSSFQQADVQGKLSIKEAKERQGQWLANLSPDLFDVYKETEERIREVTPLVDSPEDEYFLEQIQKDYYPHIFTSLKNLARTEVDFNYKETVVVESIKQFKIIQLGLQKIVDSTVARNLTSIRSQTDFLMHKVLGPNSLSLSSKEADSAIEATLEEAKKVREDLYKNHVLPVLEQNKQEYTEALDQHQKKLDRLESIYSNSVKAIRKAAQESVAKAEHNYNMDLKSRDVALAKQEWAYEDEISSYKKGLDQIIEDHRKEILQKDQHLHMVNTLLDKTNADLVDSESTVRRLTGKYQALLRSNATVESMTNTVKKDGVTLDSDQTIQEYKAQVSKLKTQVYELQDQVMELVDSQKSAVSDDYNSLKPNYHKNRLFKLSQIEDPWAKDISDEEEYWKSRIRDENCEVPEIAEEETF